MYIVTICFEVVNNFFQSSKQERYHYSCNHECIHTKTHPTIRHEDMLLCHTLGN